MPISGPSSFVSTVPLFQEHWTECNAALGAAPILLPAALMDRLTPAVALADLDDQFAALTAQRLALGELIVFLDLLRADRDLGAAALIARLVQFNDFVRLYLAGKRWERVLPAAPTVGEAASKITDPLDRVATLWGALNDGGAAGLTLPVMLLDGYALEDFQTELGTLKTVFRDLGKQEVKVDVAMEERNDVQDVIYGILKAYRQAVPQRFAAGSAEVTSLPLLTPLPGRTPDPVPASGVWDAVAVQGRVVWTASAEAELEKYEVRYSPGLVYHSDAESVVGTVLPGDPLELLTLTGLTVSGAKALFRVYVVLTTGNEAGSNDVLIERP